MQDLLTIEELVIILSYFPDDKVAPSICFVEDSVFDKTLNYVCIEWYDVDGYLGITIYPNGENLLEYQKYGKDKKIKSKPYTYKNLRKAINYICGVSKMYFTRK